MRVESLEHRRLLAVQAVDPAPIAQTVDPGGSVTFDVNYSTNPDTANLSGLGFQMHFDSSVLTFESSTNQLTTGWFPDQLDDDTTNDDADTKTDKLYRVAWSDPIGQKWPGVGATRLFTANFTAASDATGSTTIHFVPTSTTANWTFGSTDSTISFNANTPPTSEAGGPYSVNESGTIVLDGSASTDPNQSSDSLTYEWDLDDDGLFGETGVDATRGDETGMTPTFSAAGLTGPSSVTVSLRVTDNNASSHIDTATINVVDEISEIVTLSATSTEEGNESTLSGTLTDPGVANASTLEVDWGDNSPLETFNYAAGVTSFSETHTYMDDDPSGTLSDIYTINVTLKDDGGGTDTASTTMRVSNNSPMLSDLSIETPFEGGAATLVMTISDSTPLDSFRVEVNWGDGTPSEFFDYPAGSTSFSESHNYVDDNPTNTPQDEYNVIALITDDDGGFDGAGTSVFIQNVAPTLTNVVATTILEGETTTLTAEVVDPGVLDTFEVEIDWNDGSPVETFSLPVGVMTFSKNHSFPDDDPTGTPSDDHPITIKVTDDDTGFSITDATVTINDIAPTLSNLTATAQLDEGGAGTITGSMADIGTLDTFSLEVDWGDGSAVETFNYAFGTTTFSETHTFLDDTPTGTAVDNIPVTVTLVDDDTLRDTETVTIQVNNLEPTLSDLAVTDSDEGGTSTLTGTLADIGTLDALTLEVDWGDGSAVETFNYAAGTTSFSENHSYLDDNPSVTPEDDYTIQVTLLDDDTGSDTGSVIVTIANVAPTVDLGVDLVADEGQLLNFTGTVLDPGSLDVHTIAWDFGDNSPIITGTLTPTHVYADNGSYDVTLTVTDDDRGSHSDTLSVQVGNVAPIVTAANDHVANLGVSVTHDLATFIDLGTLDSHTATIDWGDGTAVEAGTVTEAPFGPPGDEAGMSGAISGIHTYTQTGAHTVTVTVLDDDGDSHSASLTIHAGTTIQLITPDPVTQNVIAGDPASFSVLYTTSPEAPSLPGLSLQMHFDSTILTFDGLTGILPTGLVQQQPPAPDTADSDADPNTDLFVLIQWDDPASDWPGSLPVTLFTADFTSQPLVNQSTGVNFTATPAPGWELAASSATIIFNEPPIAEAAGPYTVDEGGTVVLDASGTTDDVPGVLIYEWDFDGDGIFGETGTDATQGEETGVSPTFSAVGLNGPDTLIVDLHVTDEGGLVGSDTATIDITNVAPLVDVGADASVDEGTAFTQTGSFIDPGADTWTATVDYGEGDGAEPLTLNPDMTFDLNHTYPDNDTFTISVTITDDDGSSHTDSLLVTVENVAPVISGLVATTTDENGNTTLSGTLSDTSLDPFTLSIDWGDGMAIETLQYPAGTTDVSVPHQYLDDPMGTVLNEFTISITLEDDDAGQSTNEVLVTVNNVAPVLSNLAATPVDEGSSSTLTGTILDVGTLDTFTLQVDWGDGSAIENFDYPVDTTDFTETHLYLDNPDGFSPGEYTISVTLLDDDMGTNTQTTLVEVSNVGPVVDASDDVTVDEGIDIAIDGLFIDPGADAWTATVDYGDGSGVIPLDLNPDQTFVLNHIYPDEGQFDVSVSIEDDDGAEHSDLFSVTIVSVTPTILIDPAITVNENETFLVPGSFFDPGDDAWTATVDYGDGSGELPLALNPDQTFELSHVYPDDAEYLVTVTVTDTEDMLVGTGTSTFTVANVNPTVDASPDFAMNEGESFSGSATFTDPGTDTWTATIDYGDGTALESIDLNLAQSFVLNHVYTDDGVFDVEVRVIDDDGGVGIDTLTVTVSNVSPMLVVGPDATANEGQTLTSPISLIDPGADTWTVLVDYGDGTGVQTIQLHSLQTFNLSHVYADNGVFTVDMILTDDDGGSHSDSLSVTVANVNPVVLLGSDTWLPEGNPFSGSGSFSDPGDDTWTATVDYGDGTPEESLTLHADGTFDLNHLYTSVGSFTVTVTVVDSDLGEGVDTLVVTLGNVSPHADAGGPYEVDEGRKVRLDASASSDPANDIATYEWDLDGDNLYESSGVSVLFSGVDDGVYLVRLRVTDQGGLVGTDQTTVTVNNVAPTARVGPNLIAGAGEPIELIGWYTDPGTLDTHTFEWDFGDGSAVVTDALRPLHTYTATGSYQATFTVTDDDGGTNSETVLVVVNDFPNPTDILELGTTDYLEVVDLDPSGMGQWLSFQSYRDGILSLLPSTDGSVVVSLYDANFMEVPVSISPSGRVDALVDSLHQTFYVHVMGSVSSVDLRVVNLARNVGPVFEIFGTADNDQFGYDASTPRVIHVKGVDYQFDDSVTETVTFYGMTGDDELVLHDSSGDDLLRAWVKQVSFTGPNFALEAVGFETLHVVGNAGGTDTAQLYDSAGDDTFISQPGFVEFWGDQFLYHVESFENVHAYAKYGGNDTGNLSAPPGDNRFIGTMDWGRLVGRDSSVRAKFFESLVVQASEGFNSAIQSDSPEIDQFTAHPNEASFTRTGYSTTLLDFDEVIAKIKYGGDDRAQLYDSAGDDLFVASPMNATLRGDDFRLVARGFREIHGYSKAGGHDIAKLYDSVGDDFFKATPTFGILRGEGFSNRAKFFDRVHAYATNGGFDKTYFQSDSLEDSLIISELSTQLVAEDYVQRAKFFDDIYADYGDGGKRISPTLNPVILLPKDPDS